MDNALARITNGINVYAGGLAVGFDVLDHSPCIVRQDTPPTVVKSNKLYEVQKFVSKTDHVLTTAYVVANPGKFDAMSADEQATIVAAAQAADEELRKFAQNNEAAAYEFLGQNGMEVTLEVDGDSFRVATASVLADNPDLFPPELVELARSTSA